MQPYKLNKIRYKKLVTSREPRTVEITERSVIPLSSVTSNIRAVDVTDLDTDAQTQTQELLSEYAQYLDTHAKTAFSFEDWVSHTKGVEAPTLKYRTFKLDQTEIL